MCGIALTNGQVRIKELTFMLTWERSHSTAKQWNPWELRPFDQNCSTLADRNGPISDGKNPDEEGFSDM